jgi:hypothetical protein
LWVSRPSLFLLEITKTLSFRLATPRTGCLLGLRGTHHDIPSLVLHGHIAHSFDLEFLTPDLPHDLAELGNSALAEQNLFHDVGALGDNNLLGQQGNPHDFVVGTQWPHLLVIQVLGLGEWILGVQETDMGDSLRGLFTFNQQFFSPNLDLNAALRAHHSLADPGATNLDNNPPGHEVLDHQLQVLAPCRLHRFRLDPVRFRLSLGIYGPIAVQDGGRLQSSSSGSHRERNAGRLSVPE